MRQKSYPSLAWKMWTFQKIDDDDDDGYVICEKIMYHSFYFVCFVCFYFVYLFCMFA